MNTRGTLGSTVILLGLLFTVVLLAHSGTAPFQADDAALGNEPDVALTVNVTAIPCPEGYDNQEPDDVCLAYDGKIPGPTWVFEKGQSVELTVNHNVTPSVQEVTMDEDLQDHLADARYSLHRHGISVAACHDGVAQPLDTNVCESAVGPEGERFGEEETITYAFTTPFPGYWHYHDHAKGLDAGTQGHVIGSEAQKRGLFGSFLVLERGETTDHAFNMHVLDTGINGGVGFHEEAQKGDRFDIILTGLGEYAWEITLTHDVHGLVDEEEIGPGVSRGFTVHDAQSGTYTLTATSALGGMHEGQVVVS